MTSASSKRTRGSAEHGGTQNRRTARRRWQRRPRRAVVAVIVLLMIAMALAASYSAMRSQTVMLQIRDNASRNAPSLQATLTGLGMGLNNLNSADWQGSGTSFSETLGPNETVEITFLAGDTTLAPTDPYSPYRVTMLIVGTVTDPTDARRVSTHKQTAVFQIIPRALPSEPTDWSTMQPYTLYQTEVRVTTLDIPCRIEGDVRLQGQLRLGEHYPDDSDAWSHYFHHQQTMRDDGYEDARSLTGEVHFPHGFQDPVVVDLLSNYMNVPCSHRNRTTMNSDWTKPTGLTSYQIYPGGPLYEIPWIASPISNEELLPLTDSNPLGLFYCRTNLTIGDNVTVRGTLFCKKDIAIDGTNIRFESVALPPLSGSEEPIRLPVITCRDFDVEPGASCTVDGLLASFGHVNIKQGSPRGMLELAGKVITENFDVRQDERWANVDWEQQFDDFHDAWSSGGFPPLFTVWMDVQGYPWAPTVHVEPGTDVQYHWHRPDDWTGWQEWPDGPTIFLPHPDDYSDADPDETPFLRWELIHIEDGV